MRFRTFGVLAAASLISMPVGAEAPMPSIAEIHADPIAAYQGVWESRFCSKDYQWKVEGRVVRLHRRESSNDPYINRHSVGDPVILLEGPWDQSDRGVRLYASFVEPGNGYRSKGNAAALTSYGNDRHTYLSFNEMIRPEEKRRQCGGSSAKKNETAAKPKPTRAQPALSVTKASDPASDAKPDDLPPAPKGPTANQLKYQRELAAHQERLAEIERITAETAAKLARDKAAAQQVIDRHRQEMDVNRQQVAAADRARRQYQEELAAHEAQTKQLRTKKDRDALADWPEAVTVCELNAQNPQAKFGNWRCEGPLQMDYAKLGNGGQVDPGALFNVSNACGGKVESVRDLGTVSGYRVFGCSYGMHPNSAQRLANDAAAKFGLSYVPGRITYRCPTWQSGCRVR